MGRVPGAVPLLVVAFLAAVLPDGPAAVGALADAVFTAAVFTDAVRAPVPLPGPAVLRGALPVVRHVPASGIAAATRRPSAAALSSASRSRSSRGCWPMEPTGAAKTRTVRDLLAAARQSPVTWSG
ncbi:hypothetical protein SSPS47_06215 [Streptomyces sp. S4.7]|nr:hypothetical protein SSPS47_06215 [Streptomyces sp. S4.7]